MNCHEITTQLQGIKTKKRELDDLISRRLLDEAKRVQEELSAAIETLKNEAIEIVPGFREMYQSQVETLTQLDILQELSDGKKGMIGIDGKEYPLPEIRDIVRRLNREKRETLMKKYEQGFTKLLLVPFGVSLDILIEKYGQALIAAYRAGKLKATNGDKLDLDENEPVSIWTEKQQNKEIGYPGADIDGRLLYGVSQFDRNNPGGQTKQQLIDTGQAWQVILIEDLPDLPAQGQGKDIGGRKQIEANQTPKEYLEKIGKGEYTEEHGLTPESWLMYAITQLQETNQVIDDWQGQGKLCFLTGAYFPSSGHVPYAYWRRDYSQARLGRAVPSSRDSSYGVRSSVEVI